MQRYETSISQLGLVGGIRQQRSDLITVVEPESLFTPEARKGRLFLLVEAEATVPRSAQLCQLAARTIRQVFYEDSSYSVTAALRAAIRAANKAVYEQNISLQVMQRSGVGLTAAVLKDSDLFIVQVQPAQIYVFGEGKLRALPAHPSWDPAHVSAAPFSHGGALGASLFIEPELFRCTMQKNDMALLCSSGFAQLLGRSLTGELLRSNDPDLVINRLADICGEHNLSDAQALALALKPALSPVAEREPLSPAGVSERSRLAARTLGGWLTGISGEFARVARGNRAPARKPESDAPAKPDPLYTMPEQPRRSPNPPARPAPIELGEGLSERYERSRAEQHQREQRRHETRPEAELSDLPPSAYLGEGEYPGIGNHPIDLGDGPMNAASARPYKPRIELRPMVDLTWSERLALPFQRLGIMVEDVIHRQQRRRRAVPPPRPILRGQGLSYRRVRPPFPWLMLLVLTLVVGTLIVYGVNLSRQNDQQLALEYFSAADQRLAAVRAATSDTAALEALDMARQAIDEVRSSPNVTDTNPTFWLRYQELQREYERALAAVQRLTFFDNPVVLASHPLPTGRFSSIVVPPPASHITDTNQLEMLRYIYALDADTENARLYRIPRDGGTPEPYLSPNQPVGSGLVGPLRAALWRIDQVVAVDQAPNGFGYYFRSGNSWNYSKLGSSEIWAVRDRLDIEEYDGNLYIWGAQPNEVLKFNSGNYGDTPEFWLDPASLEGLDLSTVVDMAVDGTIYLLKPNGTVMLFGLGRLVGEVKPDAITPPISAVTHFAVTGKTPEDGSIFLLEPLNERIIQMNKQTGAVIQQIKVRPDGDLRLDELSTLSVDDTGARPILYIANRGQIIRAELPAPPRSFREESNATPAPTTMP